MKLFVDTGIVKEVEALAALGVIDGATTNPSLMAKAGGDPRQILKEICRIVQGPVSGEVVATDYEGMLREIESPNDSTPFRVLQGKTAMSQLAESLTLRLCRIMGGSTYGRGSPYGIWFEDVRALGFLRPPWVLAFDNLWGMSWQTP